jgi:hypothetical protein
MQQVNSQTTLTPEEEKYVFTEETQSLIQRLFLKGSPVWGLGATEREFLIYLKTHSPSP